LYKERHALTAREAATKPNARPRKMADKPRLVTTVGDLGETSETASDTAIKKIPDAVDVAETTPDWVAWVIRLISIEGKKSVVVTSLGMLLKGLSLLAV
jgi:hypothetical protein